MVNNIKSSKQELPKLAPKPSTSLADDVLPSAAHGDSPGDSSGDLQNPKTLPMLAPKPLPPLEVEIPSFSGFDRSRVPRLLEKWSSFLSSLDELPPYSGPAPATVTSEGPKQEFLLPGPQLSPLKIELGQSLGFAPGTVPGNPETPRPSPCQDVPIFLGHAGMTEGHEIPDQPLPTLGARSSWPLPDHMPSWLERMIPSMDDFGASKCNKSDLEPFSSLKRPLVFEHFKKLQVAVTTSAPGASQSSEIFTFQPDKKWIRVDITKKFEDQGSIESAGRDQIQPSTPAPKLSYFDDRTPYPFPSTLIPQGITKTQQARLKALDEDIKLHKDKVHALTVGLERDREIKQELIEALAKRNEFMNAQMDKVDSLLDVLRKAPKFDPCTPVAMEL